MRCALCPSQPNHSVIPRLSLLKIANFEQSSKSPQISVELPLERFSRIS